MEKLLNNKILLSLMLIGLLKPSGIDGLETYVGGVWRIVSFSMTLLQYVSIVFIVVIAICYHFKMSKMFLAISLYQGLFLISDFVNGISIMNDLKHIVLVVCLCLLVSFYADKGLLGTLIKTASIIFGTLVLLNFLSILLFPDGMYRDAVEGFGRATNFFLGYKNRHIYYYLPFVGLSSLSDFERKGSLSWKTITLSIVTVLSSILCGSSTSSAAMLVVVILLVMCRDVKLPEKISVFSVIISSIAVTIIIVSGVQSGIIDTIVYDLFGKNATFTGRTRIWQAALILFVRSPIIGNGTTSEIAAVAAWQDISQAHNKYLDILYVGGIVMAIAFVAMFFILSEKIKKQGHSIQTNIILFVFVGYAILFLMESAKTDVVMYFFIMIAYYADTLRLTSSEHHKVKIILRKR